MQHLIKERNDLSEAVERGGQCDSRGDMSRGKEVRGRQHGDMTNTRSGLTSLAIVVMNAGGLEVATRDGAWRAERAGSAAGWRGGGGIVMLTRQQGEDSRRKGGEKREKNKGSVRNRVKRLDTAYNVRPRSTRSLTLHWA